MWKSPPRPAIDAVKLLLREQRERLGRLHEGGAAGTEVCELLADMLDSAVLRIYAEAVADEPADLPAHALVAHGGFGRRDVAPYSDVDLMLLAAPGASPQCKSLARRLLQDLCDAGLQVGFNMREPKEAWRAAQDDVIVYTSLVESRYLIGSAGLYANYFARFRRDATRRANVLIENTAKSRLLEAAQYGDTVYLLQPNVKRSAGGLRDMQLARWVGFAQFGEAEMEECRQAGAMPKADCQRVRQSKDFLLRLRNELHFNAGKLQDVLTKEQQLRIAAKWGYQGDHGLMPVQELMRDYFDHTGESLFRVHYFVDGLRRPPMLQNLMSELFSRRLEQYYRIGPLNIWATRAGLDKLKSDLVEVLHLMVLANSFGKRIDHITWMAIREAMTDQDFELTKTATARFLSLMSQPVNLADQLRRLHQLRVLEKIIPAMKRTRSLLQFNEYHKYTVDEHSIRAVQTATEFLSQDDTIGDAYRRIADKTVFHLALLIHDLGKGYEEDHSEVGLRIAADTAARLGLGDADAADLKFLVHKHLMMSHTATRHDLSNADVIEDFTQAVGRLDRLRMLFVLTCADLAAVGPGMLNSWKTSLLTQLYTRAAARFDADEEIHLANDQHSRQRREKISKLTPPLVDKNWWRDRLATVPDSYVLHHEASEVADLLARIHGLAQGLSSAWGGLDEASLAVTYNMITPTTSNHDAFHRLTGALSGRGLEILRAEVHSLGEEYVLLCFHVLDKDHLFPPPADRLERLSHELTTVLQQPDPGQPTFRRVWKAESAIRPEMRLQPTRVLMDSSSSPRFTIINVFAYDRTGLLYDIARALFDLALPVRFAMIGTYQDQVVDVFYVTDDQGLPVRDEQRLQETRNRLLQAVEKNH